MRTMEWPPVIRSGRLSYVEGTEASAVLILATVGDLRDNPFNQDGLSLGDIVFKPVSAAKARVEAALKRLAPIISVEAVTEKIDQDGDASFTIIFLDRETGGRGEVKVG